MLYLHRQEPKRGDLQQVLPGAQSKVCICPRITLLTTGTGRRKPHHFGGRKRHAVRRVSRRQMGQARSKIGCLKVPPRRLGEAGREPSLPVGVVARYARFPDYHDAHLGPSSMQLLAFVTMETLAAAEARGKVVLRHRPHHRARSGDARRSRLGGQAHGPAVPNI